MEWGHLEVDPLDRADHVETVAEEAVAVAVVIGIDCPAQVVHSPAVDSHHNHNWDGCKQVDGDGTWTLRGEPRSLYEP
jgi:hypothetical protein